MMKKDNTKIVYLPLDERPCNYNFPKLILDACGDFEVVRPSLSVLGLKKLPADFNLIKDFLVKECVSSDYLAVSLDMLLYGGIVPSRLHHYPREELKARLGLLRQLKDNNNKLRIYAFSLIMRCPSYSSADEEPGYFDKCGREIFLYGQMLDKKERGLPYEDGGLYEKVSPYIDDFVVRRKVNLDMNFEAIELTGNIIDFLIIPQDDSSVYGFTASDREKVRAHINSKPDTGILMYPGADEIGCTVLSRIVNETKNKSPKIAVIYPTEAAGEIIPPYEDRKLKESIGLQIKAGGSTLCESLEDADIILFVNAPDGEIVGADRINENLPQYQKRDIQGFIKKIKACIADKNPAAVSDVAYVNGGDIELIKMLEHEAVSMKLASYAGWNTAGNTTGTALSQAVIYFYYGDTEAHRLFLALRFYEDAGYCGYVRKAVCNDYLPAKSLNYFDSGDYEGDTSEEVKKQLTGFMCKNMPSVAKHYYISRCRMPWKRMFETELEISLKD